MRPRATLDPGGGTMNKCLIIEKAHQLAVRSISRKGGSSGKAVAKSFSGYKNRDSLS